MKRIKKIFHRIVSSRWVSKTRIWIIRNLGSRVAFEYLYTSADTGGERTRSKLTDVKRLRRWWFEVFDKLGVEGSAIEQGRMNKIAVDNA